MSPLRLPDTATIQLADLESGGPLAFPGVVLFITTRARSKNDYHLGPLITDESGRVVVSHADLLNFVARELSSGLMDYVGVEDGSGEVEIRAMTPEEVSRAAASRRHTWNTLLDGEEALFGSLAHLIALYEGASNRYLDLTTLRALKVRWDGTNPNPVYDYPIRLAPA